MFEGAGLLPQILKPYLVQQSLNEKPDFFDEKILEPVKTIEGLEKISEQHPGEPKVYEKLGWAYSKERMFGKAIENYEKAIKLNPSNPGPYNNIGNIYFLSQNRLKAIEYYQRSLSVNPAQIDAHSNIGILYYYEGKLKDAAEHFNIVLKTNPNDEKAIYYLKRMRE